VGPEPGSDTADAVGARGRTENGPGDLDYLIQRVFTAGVLLGNALASQTGKLAAVEQAIGELDDAVRAIPVVGSGLPARAQSVSGLLAQPEDRAEPGHV
jgi:hypothetical protein